ncbi:unnamed protein product, partial [Gongylonema pulchrum]|uniref:B3 domain-containing protein n=1 Tax=Gongylonema pulchrum TaxID=637853 RepID=A0A183END2_9BILA
KCTNSRQRRAKRQRRREETKAVEAAQPVISLLDDVTNAINRMEKERKLKEGVPDDCENATMLSFTDTIGNDRDMESVTVKEEIPPPHQADSSLRDSPQGVSESADVASATNSALKKSSTKSGTAVTKKSMSSHCHQQITSASLQSTAVTVTSPPRFVAEAACDKTFFVGTPKRISKQRNLEIRCVSGAGKDIVKGCNQEPAVFGADFSKSDAIKKQLLKAKTGDVSLLFPKLLNLNDLEHGENMLFFCEFSLRTYLC